MTDYERNVIKRFALRHKYAGDITVDDLEDLVGQLPAGTGLPHKAIVHELQCYGAGISFESGAREQFTQVGA